MNAPKPFPGAVPIKTPNGTVWVKRDEKKKDKPGRAVRYAESA